MTAEEVFVAKPKDQSASEFRWSVDGCSFTLCGDRMAAILNYGLGCFAQDDKVPPHTTCPRYIRACMDHGQPLDLQYTPSHHGDSAPNTLDVNMMFPLT